MKKVRNLARRYTYPQILAFCHFFVTMIALLLLTLPVRAQSPAFDATVASPESSIAWLQIQVEEVVHSEVLSKESNAAKHLLHYLDRAMGTYVKGMPAHSARHMSIFVTKVERLQHAHRVSEELCVLLIDTSQIVIEKLQTENAIADTGSYAHENNAMDNIKEENNVSGALTNSPNPFNPTTTIRFMLEEPSQVNLTVYDMAGREVKNLVNGYTDAGNHEVTFDASALPSGTYLYRLVTPTSQSVQKMVYLK